MDHGVKLLHSVLLMIFFVLPIHTLAQPSPSAKLAFNVSLICDGANHPSNAIAINAALAHASAAGAATTEVVLPSGPASSPCVIDDTIGIVRGTSGASDSHIAWSGIRLRGQGDGNFALQKTTLKWAKDGGVMLDWSTSPTSVTVGSAISGIVFDGAAKADIGIVIRNLTKSRLDTTIFNTRKWAIDANVPAGSANEQLSDGDISLNVFGNILIQQSEIDGLPSPGGWLNGSGNSTHDINSNTFENITIVTSNGDGFVCGAMDANTILYLRTQGPRNSGTTANPPGPAVGLRLKGSPIASDTGGAQACRNNTFLQAQIFGRLVIEQGASAFPARDNTIWSLGVADSFTFVEDQTSGHLNVLVTDNRIATGFQVLQATAIGAGLGGLPPARTLEVANLTNYQLRLGVGPSVSQFSYDIGRSTNDGLLHFYGNQLNANGFAFEGVNGLMLQLQPGLTLTSARLQAQRGIQLLSVEARPICETTTRGTIWSTQGTVGVADTVSVCAKDANDRFSWRAIY